MIAQQIMDIQAERIKVLETIIEVNKQRRETIVSIIETWHALLKLNPNNLDTVMTGMDKLISSNKK
jgi:hypothetical protein